MKKIESLLKDVVDTQSEEKLNLLIDSLLIDWLYFYFIEKNGCDTKPSKDNIVAILTVSKEKPINIPTILNSDGNFGVLYTNREKALKSAEFECKIGKMKGVKAFEMFNDIEDINFICIQGDYGNIKITKEEFMRLAKIA